MRENVQEWVGSKAKKNYVIMFVTVNITSILTLRLKYSTGIQHRSHGDGAVREEGGTS